MAVPTLIVPSFLEYIHQCFTVTNKMLLMTNFSYAQCLTVGDTFSGVWLISLCVFFEVSNLV